MNKGFTLIEALIAIFILTIGISAVLCMFPLSLQIGNFSQMTSTAAQLAQAKAEEIISKSYTDIFVGTTTESQLDFPFESFSRETVVTYVDSSLQYSVADTGLKKVEITVSFPSPLKIFKKSVDIITLIAER